MSPLLNPQFEPTLLSQVEDAGLNASAPPQQRWLDGWLVRFSPGKAKRARCINAVAAGQLPIAERLAACAKVYEEAQLPMIVRITPFTQPGELDALLAAQGLHRFDDTRVMVLAGGLVQGDSSTEPADAHASVMIQSIGLEAFAQRVGGFRGSSLAARQAHAVRLLNSPVPFFAFELRAEGAVLACGQFALEGTLAGLYDIYTVEAARGRGLGTVLCGRLLAEAAQRGAQNAYLQVEGDNHAARAVYHRLGFTDAYSYHYRTRDPSAA